MMPVRLVSSFVAALAFLTRIPVPRRIDRSMARVAAGQIWFPAVGLLIGLLLLIVDEAAGRALPRSAVDVLLVVAVVVITGGLHLDGLSDAADGLLGGHTREQRLEIMRDVHIGAFGVTAIACVLAMKWAGFQSLPGVVRTEAIVLVPCAARFGVLAAAAAFPSARADGLGAALREHQRFAVVAAGTTALVASIALLGAGGAYLVGAAIVCAVALGAHATRLAGGVTGDTHGATIEITEAATLLLIGAMANRGWIDAWLLA
jgi:adenosylcobinamide-GDP ribazoletransferase